MVVEKDKGRSGDSELETICHNCGRELAGRYCFDCGQKSTSLEPHFKDLAGDLTANVFSLDSRFFRTLILLLTKPGLLTIRYREGKRVQHTPPLRLYLAISVLFFFVLAFSESQLFRITSDGQEDALPQESLISMGAVTGNSGKGDEVESEETSEEPGEPALESEKVRAFEERFNERIRRASEDPTGTNERILSRLPQVIFLLVLCSLCS